MILCSIDVTFAVRMQINNKNKYTILSNDEDALK